MNENAALSRRLDGLSTDQGFPWLYEELRRTAHVCLNRLPPGQPACTTSLVHNAWIRMQPANQAEWTDLGHYLAFAARAMRSILVDYARRRRVEERGFARLRILAEIAPQYEDKAIDLLQIDELLNRLAEQDPVGAQLVELLFFAGMQKKDAARALGVSEKTVGRKWALCRAWLYGQLKDNHGP